MGACCSGESTYAKGGIGEVANQIPATQQTPKPADNGPVEAISVTGEKLDIKLYYFLLSQPSRALLSLLEMANVKYEKIHVEMFEGAHKSPEMLSINPAGQVPFLQINGKGYNESSACLRLIAQLLPTLVDTGYYPKDDFQRHTVNAMLDFNGTTYRPLHMERAKVFFKQMQNGGKINDEIQKEIDDANEKVRKSCELLEKKLTESNSKYLCGDKPTIADIQIFHQSNDVMWHGNSWAGFPKCIAWRAAMYQIPSVKMVQDRYNKEVFPNKSYTSVPTGTNIDLPQADRNIIDSIIAFWFPNEDNDRHKYVPKECMPLHFSDKNDKLITDKFFSQFERLEKGELEEWRNDHHGRLAYIIIADQFSRNMLRGQGRAFSQDSKAFEVSMSIVDDPEKMKCYRNHEQCFILLPLLHNENINSINRAIQEFEDALKRCDASGNMAFRGLYAGSMHFAIAHKVPVEKCGRYPGRNKALGRENTPAEIEYLKDAPSWAK